MKSSDPASVTSGITREVAIALLIIVFSMAYVGSPYWLPMPQIWLRMLVLGGTILVGWLWAVAVAGPLTIARDQLRLRWLLIAIVVVGALNALAITNEVPWMGDEDHHIVTAVNLVNTISRWPVVMLMAAIGAAVLAAFAGRGRRIVSYAVCILFPLALAAGVGHLNQVPPTLTRYPYVNYWLIALPPLVLSPFVRVAPPFETIYVEAFYRLVPFLSVVLLASCVARRYAGRSGLVPMLMILAVATMPVIYYYSSLLYLEMPAVLLMTVACGSVQHLLTTDGSELRGRIAWLALVLIGFIKETTAPFLLAYVLTRWMARFATGRKPQRRSGVVSEILVDFAVLAPLLMWLGYRALYPTIRPPVFNPANLLNAQLIGYLLRSYVGQLGPLLILALAGFAILIRMRAWPAVLFLTLTTGAYVLMQLADEPQFVGYSRFTLMLVPMLLACAGVAVEQTRRPAVAAGVLAIVAAANLWMSPICLDGSRRPNWGDSMGGNSEHSYPYREAMAWLNEHARGRSVVAGGLNHAYPFDLYRRPDVTIVQIGNPADGGKPRSPAEESLSTEASLRYAAEHGFDLVLQRVSGRAVPQLSTSVGFAPTTLFQNQSHVLVLYQRGPASRPDGQ